MFRNKKDINNEQGKQLKFPTGTHRKSNISGLSEYSSFFVTFIHPPPPPLYLLYSLSPRPREGCTEELKKKKHIENAQRLQ